MGEIGKITPAHNQGEEVREWRVPIEVWMRTGTRQLKVLSVFEDEGTLCIDVDLEDENGT